MTDQPTEPAAPAQPPAPAPAEPQHPGFFDRLVHPGHAEAEAAALIGDELKAVLHGHAAEVYSLAAKVFGSPEFQALRPELLSLIGSATGLAARAL